MIIGISGKAGTGKDTIAGYLKQLDNFRTIAFADEMKQRLSEAFDIPIDYFYDRSIKDSAINGSNTTPRALMQFYGQSMKDIHGDDYWINIVFGKLSSSDNVIITDVRFDKEADAVLRNDGKVLVVIRDDTGLDYNDITEQGITHRDEYFYIYNNGDLNELQNNVEAFYETVINQ